MLAKNKKIVLAFVVFLIIFSILQFTVPNIIGFDGYFNIKAADVIKEEGLIREFKWTEHSILSNEYADLQFLFKILLIPFTFFSLGFGAKIASIIFAALSFTVFYWFLDKNNIKYPLYWAFLYLFSSIWLIDRFLLTRPLPLAIAAIILTIHFLKNKKYLALGITSFVFVWLFSGFVMQLFIILIYFIIDRFFSKKFDFKLLLYAFGGALLGLLLNPYFPNNISFLYTQIFEVNLLSNLYNVEWKPWPFLEFIKNNIFIINYLIISIILVVVNKKITKLKLFYWVLTLFFFIYTIYSRRMQEFLVPFSILLLALSFNDYLPRIEPKKWFKYAKYVLVLVLAILAIFNFTLLRKEIINNDILHNYDSCAEWINDNVPENSLVFNNAYAFPYLFFKNSDLRYTHGLDLTYSFLYDEQEFKRYMAILQGNLNTNTDSIKQDYNPDYVFSGKLKQDVQLFNYIVKNKENYKAVYEDDWCAVLEVR
jgi:MFS family permease|tara:strand:- start:655 stop:2097 length:1443 start_codon:yes stop_codon:yes gene_type:complete